MPDNETIHIALAFCDPRGTYARHAAVTMASIFENCRTKPICVHILHDETLTPANKEKLSMLSGRYDHECNFVNVSANFEELKRKAKSLPIDGYRGTMFRLFLSDVLTVQKVIYLDCDIVVEMDITELWDAPLYGCSAGAVRDVWTLDFIEGKKVPWRLGKVWDLLDIPHDSYFNAGVMVLDLDRIREKYSLSDRVLEFYSQYRRCITLHDQDFLNWIFVHDVRLLDERFNHINLPSGGGDYVCGSIWHMAGGSAKPWNSYTRPYVDDLYWRYLRLTPYCKDENELLHLMLTGMAASPLMHHHSADCVKRLIKQLEDDIFRAHIWKIPPVLWKLLIKRLLGTNDRRGQA